MNPLTWLSSLLAGPVVGAVLDGYKAKLDASNSRDKLAVELAAKELERAAEDRRTLNQWGPLSLLIFAFGAVVLFWFAKIVVWDAALGLGSTDPVNGTAGRIMELIIQFLFGAGAGLQGLRMVLARFGRK